MFIFDGGMGTMLQHHRIPQGTCPDAMNLTHPDIVRHIHAEYAAAGADFITTNTFGSTPLKLAEYDLADKVEEIAAAAVSHARAASPTIRVAGDIGPTGQFIKPLGGLSFDEAASGFYRLAKALADAGADCLIIETIIDIAEMRAALTAAKAACRLPVICQMSFAEDGRTITGTDPAAAAILLDAMGADVIGANCSTGPAELLVVAQKMAAVTNRPLIIQPNAGMPVLENGETHFPLTPDDMAAYIEKFAEAGVSYTGGCCGTTPAHIRAIKEAAEKLSETPRAPVSPFTAFTSRTRTVYVGNGYPPIKIGERINPTGRKKMREDLQAGNFLSIKKEALAQEAAGADMLDVNMGAPGIDQAAAMETVVSELSMLCPTPLSIDSTDPAVIERALKVYPGRALINSVSANDALMDAVFPLAKKYGAAVLCLPLSEKGLPKTADERIEIMRRILAVAFSHGLRREDLLLDPLVLTTATDATAARETLLTLKRYRETFGLATVMGTSNVSFGLPARPQINAAFLTMAFACGMDAPIVNPLDEDIRKAFACGRLLLGYDEGAKEFIQTAEAPEVKETKETVTAAPVSTLKKIREAVLRGEKEEAAALIPTAVSEGVSTDVIIKDGLTAAMTEIGDGYGRGQYFLPQVMMAAEAMQAASAALKKLLPDVSAAPKGRFTICTVKGDIHDLGKNIVAALLENSGYEVTDLGKDVDPADLLQNAETEKPDIIGLCSLMTTTLPEMETAVKLLKEKCPHIRLMTGGAVVTPEYAEKIGADSYAKDGICAVREANRLIENK